MNRIFLRSYSAVALLLIVLLATGGSVRAGVPIKNKPASGIVTDNTGENSASAAISTERESGHLSFFKRIALARETYKMYRHRYKWQHNRNDNNHLGLVSVIASSVSLLSLFGLAAALIAGSAAATIGLLALAAAGGIVGVVFGARGIGRDRSPAMAITGMVIGIVSCAILLVGIAITLIIIDLAF